MRNAVPISMLLGASLMAIMLGAPERVVGLEYDIKAYNPDVVYTGMRLIDLNKNGRLNVLIGNRNSNTIEIWEHDPASSPDKELVLIDTITGVCDDPHDLDVADIDGDGDNDVVVGARFCGVAWFEYDSNNGSWIHHPVDGTYSWHVELEDFDFDGNLDILDGRDSNGMQIFYGDGAGGFVAGPTPPGRRALGYNAALIDDDGLFDLIGYDEDTGELAVFLNQSAPGSPAWSGNQANNSVSGIAQNHGGPTAADFDGNGYIDQVTLQCKGGVPPTCPDGMDLVIFEGNEDSSGLIWAARVIDNLLGRWVLSVIADVNDDSNPDIMVGGADGANDLMVYLGDGLGNFAKEQLGLDHGVGNLNALAAGDIDGDGLTDVVAARYAGPESQGFEVLFRRVIEVVIDIKPGSDPNFINPRSKGVITVAILTTNTFDATTIDPLSVEFGPNKATETHRRGQIEDIDSDGDDDLVLHFRTQPTGIQCGDTSAFLTGQTVGGQQIKGSDSIITVGCR